MHLSSPASVHPENPTRRLGLPAAARLPYLPTLRRHPLALAGALGLVAYALLIWLDLPAPPLAQGQVPARWWEGMQGLRGWWTNPLGWSWALAEPAPLERWLPVLALGVAGALWLYFAGRRGRAMPAVTLLGLVCLGYAGQLAALWLKYPNPSQLLFERIIDPWANGYFTAATTISDPSVLFRGYADAIRVTGEAALPEHVRTHPPGAVLFFWLPIQVLAALPVAWQQALSDLLVTRLQLTLPPSPAPPLTPAQLIVAALGGHVLLLGAALSVLPLFGLARRIAGERHAALLAAFGAVVPGMMFWVPSFDPVFVTASATLLYLGLRGLSAGRRRLWWGLPAGAWLAACLYGSFGLWTLGVPLAVWGVISAVRPLLGAPCASTALDESGRRALWLIGLAVGLLAPWGLLWLLTGFDLPAVLRFAGKAHLDGITAIRPYKPWLVFNLVEFAQFAGLPLIAAALFTLVGRYPPSAAAAPLRLPGRLARAVGRLNPYGVLFFALVLSLNISGSVRGETGRIWLFLVPLALLAVYRAVASGALGRRAVTGLLVLQLLVCVVIGGRWVTDHVPSWQAETLQVRSGAR
jgi:hypothetical protein